MSNQLVVDKSSNNEDNDIQVFIEFGVEGEDRIDSNNSREEVLHDSLDDGNHYIAEERSDLIQSLKVCKNRQGNFLKVFFS